MAKVDWAQQNGWHFASNIDAERYSSTNNIILYEDAQLTRVIESSDVEKGHYGQFYCRLLFGELEDVPCLYAIEVGGYVKYVGRDVNSLRNRFSSSFKVVTESEEENPNGTTARINHLIFQALNSGKVVRLYYKPYHTMINKERLKDILLQDHQKIYDTWTPLSWVQRRPIGDDDD